MKESPQTPADILKRASRVVVFACSLAVLASCTSVGIQYVSPLATQPHATLVPEGGSVLINSFDSEGCYQGRTELSRDEEFRLRPGQEVSMAYELHGGRTRDIYPMEGTFCRAAFSFVPNEGEHYTVRAIGTPTMKDSNGKLVMGTCGAIVSRKGRDGTLEPIELKRLVIRQRSIACIQAIEKP